ncbi:MAG: hypothetical protein IPL40_13935 [Proteobacteria bacterium]|nr:hypothetical protein [Pseudomonadota bacterium]
MRSNAGPRCCVALLALLLGAPPARGVPTRPPARATPPRLALVGDAGMLTGVAGGAQLDLGRIGLRATAGYQPLLVTVVDLDDDPLAFRFFNTAQLNVDLFSLFFEPTPGARIGAALSYRFNTLLRHGAGAACDALVTLRPRLALHIIAGLTYYPAGKARVEAASGLFRGSSFPGPALQGLVSVGLVFGLASG